MSANEISILRIEADFNDIAFDPVGVEWFTLLFHNKVPLDSAAEALGLYEGMPVIVWCDDGGYFEVDGVLGRPFEDAWAARGVGQFRYTTDGVTPPNHTP